MSRRTRQQPAPAHPTFLSNNPIFFREDGCSEADRLHALAHDDVLDAVVKPLPLPPSRTHLSAGSGRAGSALVMSRHGSGWVLRRVPHHDPFLAAYVTCTKEGGGGKVDAGASPVKRQEQRKNKNRGDAVQGCGIWSGWAAGAMSCKYGSDVAAAQGDGPAAAQAQESRVPRLRLSRQPVVIPARKRAPAPWHGDDSMAS